MSRLQVRIVSVFAGLLIVAGLSLASSALLRDSPAYTTLQLAITILLSFVFLAGAIVFLHAAVFGSEADLTKFVRPPAVWFLSLGATVRLVRIAMLGFGVFLLALGVVGMTGYSRW